MKHYLITEWNVDMLDMEWLLERQKLFEKFTLPSVQAQTNKDFEWILVSDSRTPDEFKKVLDSYPATVLYFDFENFDWESPVFTGKGTRAQHELMQRSIDLEYIAKPLREYIGTPDTDYVITSRLDNDDGISIDHIDKIQRFAKENWNGKRFWLNLVRGLKYNHGDVFPVNSPHSPFISFVESPKGLLTTYHVSHTEAKKCTKHTIIQVREGKATWLQVIHGGNLLNRLKRHKGKVPFSTVAERFKIDA